MAKAAAPFDDVAEESYCAAAVAWAAEEGIVNGYGDGRFWPDDPATREQLAAILFRFAAYLGLDTDGRGELSAFSDGDEASGYARDALSWAVDQAMAFRALPAAVQAREVSRVMRDAAERFNHKVCAKAYISMYERMLKRPLVSRRPAPSR